MVAMNDSRVLSYEEKPTLDEIAKFLHTCGAPEFAWVVEEAIQMLADKKAA